MCQFFLVAPRLAVLPPLSCPHGLPPQNRLSRGIKLPDVPVLRVLFGSLPPKHPVWANQHSKARFTVEVVMPAYRSVVLTWRGGGKDKREGQIHGGKYIA